MKGVNDYRNPLTLNGYVQLFEKHAITRSKNGTGPDTVLPSRRRGAAYSARTTSTYKLTLFCSNSRGW